jgi:hypothetical protein
VDDLWRLVSTQEVVHVRINANETLGALKILTLYSFDEVLDLLPVKLVDLLGPEMVSG